MQKFIENRCAQHIRAEKDDTLRWEKNVTTKIRGQSGKKLHFYLDTDENMSLSIERTKILRYFSDLEVKKFCFFGQFQIFCIVVI